MKSLFEKNLIEWEDDYYPNALKDDFFIVGDAPRTQIIDWNLYPLTQFQRFGHTINIFTIGIKTEKGIAELQIYENISGTIVLFDVDSGNQMDLLPEYRDIDRISNSGEAKLRNWGKYNIPEKLIKIILKLADTALEFKLKEENDEDAEYFNRIQ